MTAHEFKRWYDRDPVLRQALETLRDAPNKYHAQVALNIILIIVEHQIESDATASVNDLVQTLERSRDASKNYTRRWYDVNETLRSAIQLLHDCPDDVQDKVIPRIAKMVEDSLKTVSLHG